MSQICISSTHFDTYVILASFSGRVGDLSRKMSNILTHAFQDIRLVGLTSQKQRSVQRCDLPSPRESQQTKAKKRLCEGNFQGHCKGVLLKCIQGIEQSLHQRDPGRRRAPHRRACGPLHLYPRGYFLSEGEQLWCMRIGQCNVTVQYERLR